MKIHTMTLTAILAAAVMVSACKRGDDHHTGHMMDTDTTRTVMLGDVQAVFDLMDRAHHEGMMTKMGKASGVEGKFSHYVLLTMMKKAERKLIMDAEVSFSMTGPDGKTVDKNGHVMTGGGMHHYAAGFDMEAKGEYKLKALIRRGGSDQSAETMFMIK